METIKEGEDMSARKEVNIKIEVREEEESEIDTNDLGERSIPIEILGRNVMVIYCLYHSIASCRAGSIEDVEEEEEESVFAVDIPSKRTSLIITHEDGTVEENEGQVTCLGLTPDFDIRSKVSIEEFPQGQQTSTLLESDEVTGQPGDTNGTDEVWCEQRTQYQGSDHIILSESQSESPYCEANGNCSPEQSLLNGRYVENAPRQEIIKVENLAGQQTEIGKVSVPESDRKEPDIRSKSPEPRQVSPERILSNIEIVEQQIESFKKTTASPIPGLGDNIMLEDKEENIFTLLPDSGNSVRKTVTTVSEMDRLCTPSPQVRCWIVYLIKL